MPPRSRPAGHVAPNLDGVELVLYRLPEIQGQADVVIVEGEKDADALARLGIAATCNVMGAGAPRTRSSRRTAPHGAPRQRPRGPGACGGRRR